MLPSVAAEQDGARVAGAGHLALLQLEQVLVLRRERSGAKFAHFGPLARLADETLQRRERSPRQIVSYGVHVFVPA
jgi:hypothetical protein